MTALPLQKFVDEGVFSVKVHRRLSTVFKQNRVSRSRYLDGVRVRISGRNEVCS
jgi:hypothetical protein